MTEFHPTPILVPTDLSQASVGAVRTARSLAKSDANVIVAFVGLEHDLVAPAHVWGMDSVVEDNTEASRERLRKWLADNNLGEVRQEVRRGDPGLEICALAKEEACPLIVVPSHGRSGLSRMLLGSVAERIIRHCECSVLVLRREDPAKPDDRSSENWLPRNRVVVPVDLSQSTSSAIATALEMVEQPDHLHIINVIFTLEDVRVTGDVALTEEDLRENRREHLRRYLAERDWDELPHEILFGEPGITITDYIKDINADLVVMPSHGFHGLDRLLLGSTTERVIRHSSAPVLVLRRRDST